MRRHHRIRHLILLKYVRHGKFSAEGIPAMGKIHLSDLIRIRLHQNRNPCILQCRDGSVFIDEDRLTEDHSVILPLMGFQPLCIESALIPGLHCSVPGRILIHDQILIPCIRHRLHKILSGTLDQLCRHKSSVSKIQRKSHVLFPPGFFFYCILFFDYNYFCPVFQKRDRLLAENPVFVSQRLRLIFHLPERFFFAELGTGPLF